MLTTLKTVATSCYSALFLILLVGLAACAPKGPKALLEGEKLLQAGKPAEALVLLKQATELLPQNAQAWNHLGLAYHQTGKLEDAAQAYNQALRLDRDLVAVRYNLGTLMLDHGDPARALNEFKTFTLLKPESVEGHVQQGTAHLRLRQWSEAESAFVTAQKLDKSNPEALNGLGLVLLQRQRVRDAATYFNAAIQQDPKFAAARLNLAVIYHQHLTNYPLALTQYRAYLASQPPPADMAEVSSVVKQLESLVPGAQTTSNAGPVNIAAAAAAARSNALAAKTEPVKPVDPSKPVEVAAVPAPVSVIENPVNLPPPAAVKPEATKQMAKAEPVRVESKSAAVTPAPAPRPVAPPVVKPPTVVTQAPPPVNVPIPVTPAEKVSVASAAPAVAATMPEERPGFFQRINPVNLFRSKPKPPTPLSGLPPTMLVTNAKPKEVAKTEPKSRPAPAVELPAPAPTPVIASPPVIKPAPIPRYPYLKPGPFLAGDKKEAQAAFDSALAAQKVRNLPEAIAGYRRAAIADPAYFEAYYNLGWTAYEAKDLRQALVAYEHALAVAPDSFDARYNFALTLQQAGYPQDAAEELQTLTNRFPGRAQPHLMMASLLSTKLRDKVAARQHYQKVLELEPDHPKAAEIRYWLRANQ
ncbi:MAG TPA: tetratricopeptide repeat protein [Verrucomicrobiae bacterium]